MNGELMDELLKLISSFPHLDEKDIDHIKKIMSRLEEKNLEHFNKALAEDAENLHSDIKKYMSLWFDFIHKLIAWNAEISNIWIELLPKKSMSSDDLLPLTIKLLPDNDYQTIIVVLYQALQIDSLGEPEFVITTLCSAMMGKSIKPSEISEEQDEHDIDCVIDEYRRRDLIKKLINACDKSKEQIKGKISESLNDVIYYQRGHIIRDKNEITNRIIGDIQEGICLALANETTVQLIETYQAIGDLHCTLNRRGMDSRQILIEYSEKSSVYKEMFLNSDIGSASYFGFSHFHHLLWWKSKDESYAETLGIFSVKIHEEAVKGLEFKILSK